MVGVPSAEVEEAASALGQLSSVVCAREVLTEAPTGVDCFDREVRADGAKAGARRRGHAEVSPVISTSYEPIITSPYQMGKLLSLCASASNAQLRRLGLLYPYQ